jgi:hypothetical protein
LRDRVQRLLRSTPELIQQGHKVRRERQRRAAEEGWRRRAEEVRAQLNQLLGAINDHIPGGRRAAVAAALAYREEDPDDRHYRGSIEDWFDDICKGWSRLPPDLSAEAMCRLFLVRLLERENRDSAEEVCEVCGLQRPCRTRPPMTSLRPGGPPAPRTSSAAARTAAPPSALTARAPRCGHTGSWRSITRGWTCPVTSARALRREGRPESESVVIG